MSITRAAETCLSVAREAGSGTGAEAGYDLAAIGGCCCSGCQTGISGARGRTQPPRLRPDLLAARRLARREVGKVSSHELCSQGAIQEKQARSCPPGVVMK